MAYQTIDDSSLIDSLLEVFRVHGYESATLAQLSAATGLKKSSLYHRFPAGKEDMAKAVVVYVSTQLHSQIIEPLSNHKNAPKKRFSDMITVIRRFYDDGKKNCLLNVLTIGRGNPGIKALLKNDYDAWRTALVNLAKEAGMSQKSAEQRSEHFLIVVQGALVVQRLIDSASTFQSSLENEQKAFFK